MSGDITFPRANGARGNLAAFADGVGTIDVDFVATEPMNGAGDVDVNVALQDLGAVLVGAECHIKTAIDYAPGAKPYPSCPSHQSTRHVSMDANLMRECHVSRRPRNCQRHRQSCTHFH